jgi:ABC-type sugar transport system ATPase subunit
MHADKRVILGASGGRFQAGGRRRLPPDFPSFDIRPRVAAMPEPPRLLIRGLRKNYRGGIVALDGIDLDLPHGERLSVIGPSAAGKSTLLRLIAGLERPDAGSVAIDGTDQADLPPHRRPVRLLLQEPALVPYWRVDRNATFGRRPEPADRDLLHRLGLAGLERRRPGELSGGQRQRVVLARAIRASPRVLLLDEPFARLDPPARLELRALLTRLVDDAGISALLVTHDPAEAMGFGRRLAVLIDGRLAQVGPPESVHDRPASVAVARLLGDPPMNVLPAGLAPGVRDGAAYIGVRPERVRLVGVDDPQALRGRVVLDEPRGGVRLLRVELDAAALWVLIPREARPAGAHVLLGIDPAACVRFDAEGNRLDD